MRENDIQREFGRRVCELRKRHNLTQDQLAAAIGKSVDTISNIERGFSSTRISTAAAIAAKLDVPLSDLFREQANSPEASQRQTTLDRLAEIIAACDQETLNAIVQVSEITARVGSRASRGQP
jgi:transcriptional regulator with XRE-family HTH domain